MAFFLISLVFIFFFYFLFIFNINDYKEDIVHYVSSKTKYNFAYDGDIDIRYFPTYVSMPSINIYKKSSDNSKESIIRIEKLELNVSPFKLLKNIIEIDSVKASNLRYYSINIDEVLMKTYSLLKFNLFNSYQNNITDIISMSSTASLVGDIMDIDDIYIETNILKSKGRGTINIVTKEVNFKMLGSIKDKKYVTGIYYENYPIELSGEELPIIIKGPLDNLSISIDLTHIVVNKVAPLKDKVIDEIKEKMIDEIRDKIKLPF